jgi:hypothetical protein
MNADPLVTAVRDFGGAATDLDALAGEMLATLKANIGLGRLRSDDDARFIAMIEAWHTRLLAIRLRVDSIARK